MPCRFLALLILFAFSSSHPPAAQAQETQNTCTAQPPITSYRPIAADQKDPQHLQLERDFHTKGPLEIKICAGEVHIFPSQDQHLHLNISLRKAPGSSITVYIRQIESDDNKTIVYLAYPKDLSPSITLRIPSNAPLQSDIMLDTGNLGIRGDAIPGDRQIHVGVGHVTLYLRGDEYSELQTNVGIGNVHDHRQSGTSTHLGIATKQALRGKGDGKITANVGVGSIELRPEE
ncbi:hypothetical protein [Edaphobacter aggregans]|uniref:hypothetical protein n=1 Tax=Edaphobacter aggregans TaxID=570835 RepID=UPI0012F7FCE9|nr:hypothetical protein [Edaphobacter aggregans]